MQGENLKLTLVYIQLIL